MSEDNKVVLINDAGDLVEYDLNELRLKIYQAVMPHTNLTFGQSRPLFEDIDKVLDDIFQIENRDHGE